MRVKVNYHIFRGSVQEREINSRTILRSFLFMLVRESLNPNEIVILQSQLGIIRIRFANKTKLFDKNESLYYRIEIYWNNARLCLQLYVTIQPVPLKCATGEFFHS